MKIDKDLKKFLNYLLSYFSLIVMKVFSQTIKPFDSTIWILASVTLCELSKISVAATYKRFF
jgi:hypothetical protein